MLAIGNDELESAPKLDNKLIKCHMCGRNHKVTYADKIMPDGTKIPSQLLAFFRCRGKSYLAGINGKDIRRI